MPLLDHTERGIYCEAGNFYIDPWKGVDFAIVTHAHSDHARIGSRYYLCAEPGRGVLRERLGPEAIIEGLPYGKRITRNGVTVSLHPAGHILGSAQVRVEHGGEIWVASGDYKVQADPTCLPFEPIRCHTFITESTFGLPIYHWPAPQEVFRSINNWWRKNQEVGRTSVVFAYSLGKAQRVLAGVDPSPGPIFAHGAVTRLLSHYAAAGVELPALSEVDVETVRAAAGCGLVIAPAATNGSPWLRRFGEVSTAFTSGWMMLRGARRRQALDRGFVLSDHADWDGLLDSIRTTGAERILVTHGHTEPMVRWLRENGWDAHTLKTQFTGESAEESEPLPVPA